jgi:hypothetical protein
MGSDLKQGFISSLKSAWQTLNEFARAHTSTTQLQEELEKVANQIKEEEEKQVVEGKWDTGSIFQDRLCPKSIMLVHRWRGFLSRQIVSDWMDPFPKGDGVLTSCSVRCSC